MNAKTLRALRGSIKKWEKIVAGTGMDEGTDNCPLCKMFNNLEVDDGKECVGCPVHDKTGKTCCDGSPYPAFCKARRDGLTTTPYAKAELKFLKSLLPRANAE